MARHCVRMILAQLARALRTCARAFNAFRALKSVHEAISRSRHASSYMHACAGCSLASCVRAPTPTIVHVRVRGGPDQRT